MSDAGKRACGMLLMMAVGMVSGGATCARREPALTMPPPPPVLSGTPTLDQVATAVNRTAAVRELSSNTASVDVVSMPSVPKLSATLAVRRERDFRLRASLPIVLGSGLDLGSNSQLFWFEVPEGMGRTLYYADHERYRQQLQRAILPVDPTWVTDALGLVQIDPSQVLQGPVMRPDGKLEIRSQIPMPAGVFQRVCYIDAQAGHVTDQLMYSPEGELIAESHATNHRYYVDQQCSLPHRVRFSLRPATGPPLEMQIDIGAYAVNQILSGDPNLFVMPREAGQVVDLTTLSPVPLAAQAGVVSESNVQPTSFQSPGYQSESLGPLPYRGLVEAR